MSGYLFDTCVVRKWYAKHAPTEVKIQALPGDLPLYISSITLGEIEFGHLNPAATDLAKQADFRRWMRQTFEVPEISISGSTAIEYAKFRRRLFDKFATPRTKYPEQREDKLGEKIGIDENDLWLVSQACERNLTFVTHDAMNKITQIVDTDVRIVVWPET